ncbi:MAG: glycosyltransferase family 2 protein, partial [Pseudomonadota bacterium]
MSEAQSTSLDTAAWEVPEHEVALYRTKQNRYALVIPVINEGERIRGQLKRIQDAGLNVDVVVADGGSTDGSLDVPFIEAVEVRAVLTKTGPGKLSAQLRVAYAWCLGEGYDGIVTIDGNGKDGVEAIGDMIAKLDEGCDYVQGSRYLPGGLAENTPLERTIANRLIHAPLLSFAAGSFFSDTTNGFRAYSSRYLLHPDVQPFRDEFQVYGLLFYLTVRAGQLGLKVDQVPVKRRYPESGKVPTKIGGFASKLALLGETVHAATGGHTPDRAGRASASLLWPALLLLAVVAPLLLSVVVAPPYSPDSWAFWELAQTVFGDFYRITHFRSYANDVGYSSAFPPLFPSLIALIDAALGTGVRTGLYLSFACYIGFATVSELIGRRLLRTPLLGLSAAFLTLFGHNMVLTEMQAGRTIPLQLLFFALVLLGLCNSQKINVKRAIAIGLIAGLCVLNRFDAVLFPFVTAGLIAWLTRKPALALVSFIASATAISPWIAYSWATFAVPFATDNSGIATSLDPRAFVTDWWPTPQPSFADDPAAWLVRVAGNLPSLLYTAASLAF